MKLPEDNEILVVPEDRPDDWVPEGYEPGVDDPGPVETECKTSYEEDLT